MLSMKHFVAATIIVFLTGCGEDVNTSVNSEADKEPEMFLDELLGKNPKKTYVIASPMDGVLMQNGKPLAHTQIIRHLWWNGNEDGLEETFVTDEQGQFSLPVHEEQLSLGKLTQFTCSTFLEVVINSQRFDVWYNHNLRGDMYAETEGRKLDDLVCDLSNEKIEVRPGISSIMTICRWEGMPKEHQH